MNLIQKSNFIWRIYTLYEKICNKYKTYFYNNKITAIFVEYLFLWLLLGILPFPASGSCLGVTIIQSTWHRKLGMQHVTDTWPCLRPDMELHVGHAGPHSNSVTAGLWGGAGVEAVLVRSEVKLTGLARPVTRTCSWARSSVWCAWSWGCLWLVYCRWRAGSCRDSIVNRTSIVCSIYQSASIDHPSIVLAISGAWNN